MIFTIFKDFGEGSYTTIYNRMPRAAISPECPLSVRNLKIGKIGQRTKNYFLSNTIIIFSHQHPTFNLLTCPHITTLRIFPDFSSMFIWLWAPNSIFGSTCRFSETGKNTRVKYKKNRFFAFFSGQAKNRIF